MTKILDLEDVRLGLIDEGAGSPPIVFLHYWGGTSRTWSKVIELLAPCFRCIAIDQRGWGASSGEYGDFGLEALADDVVRLTKSLALGSYVLVGHSMGGKVAQILAARQPPGLAAMILVAPAPLSPIPASPEQRDAMLMSYGTEIGVREALQFLTANRLDAELERAVIEDTLSGTEAAKSSWTYAGMIADHSDLTSAIEVPTHVVVGTEDRVEPVTRMRSEVVAKIKGARLETVSGRGHLLPYEAPRRVAESIENFISSAVKPKQVWVKPR